MKKILLLVFLLIPTFASAEIKTDWNCAEKYQKDNSNLQDCTLKITVDDKDELTHQDVRLTTYKKIISITPDKDWTITLKEKEDTNKYDDNYTGNIYHFTTTKAISNKEITLFTATFELLDPKEDGTFYQPRFVQAPRCAKKAPAIKPTTSDEKIADYFYYDILGHQVTEEEYKKSCNPKCKVENNVYYNNEGKEVTEKEYQKSCNPKCEIKNNIYYNNEGGEVDKDTYNKECQKEQIVPCSEKNNKYYDKNGNEVSKESYYKSCGVVENPKTGSKIPIIFFAGAIITIILIYLYTKTSKLYKL